jgi:asparagine synthase (glutamine-hydrolysing)
MYFVCERAKQDVKVALIGQGPDELLGGYMRHIGVYYGSYWRSLPEFIRIPITAAINTLPRNESLKRGIYSLNLSDRMKRYQNVFSIMPGESIDDLFHEGILQPDSGDTILECWTALKPLMEDTDELGGFQFLEIRSSLPDELLMFADKLSMAHGLEVRVPYLDREIVEYVERLDTYYKIRNRSGKWLHRQICKDFVPETILRRRKKGFAANAVDDWFRSSFNSRLNMILSDTTSLMFQFLQPKAVQKLLTEHIDGKNNNYKILFSLVVFEEWLRSIWDNNYCVIR